MDDIEIDHRANDEEEKHELVVRQAIGNMEQSLLPAGPACSYDARAVEQQVRARGTSTAARSRILRLLTCLLMRSPASIRALRSMRIPLSQRPMHTTPEKILTSNPNACVACRLPQNVLSRYQQRWLLKCIAVCARRVHARWMQGYYRWTRAAREWFCDGAPFRWCSL